MAQWGADTARLYVLFKAPPQLELQWDEAGVVGQYRWLNRIWTMMDGLLKLERKKEREAYFSKNNGRDENEEREDQGTQSEKERETENEKETDSEKENATSSSASSKDMLRAIHDAIANVTQDLNGPAYTFNTAVAELMSLSNRIKLSQDINDDRSKVCCAYDHTARQQYNSLSHTPTAQLYGVARVGVDVGSHCPSHICRDVEQAGDMQNIDTKYRGGSAIRPIQPCRLDGRFRV